MEQKGEASKFVLYAIDSLPQKSCHSLSGSADFCLSYREKQWETSTQESAKVVDEEEKK
jgi:hypothetical protein